MHDPAIFAKTFVKLLSAINEAIFLENKVSVDSAYKAAVLIDVEKYSFISKFAPAQLCKHTCLIAIISKRVCK